MNSEGLLPLLPATVNVQFSDVIDNDFEWFLDEISERATGSMLLMDIGFELTGVTKDQMVTVEVDGDPTAILDDNELLADGDVTVVFAVRATADGRVEYLGTGGEWGGLSEAAPVGDLDAHLTALSEGAELRYLTLSA